MYQELDEIRTCIAELDVLDAQRTAAYDEAVGVYLNDPVAPTVMALVWRGRLADLKIADAICQLAPAAAAAVINGVIINAFNAWHNDYLRRLAPASGQMTG
jgi:anti-sigma factor RsiW